MTVKVDVTFLIVYAIRTFLNLLFKSFSFLCLK